MSMNEAYLVAGILLTFPLALLYRYLIPHTSANSKDTLLTLAGLALYTFCFGSDAAHVILCTAGCYLLMKVVGITRNSCIAVFFITMSHLIYGYWTKSGVSYTVTWTLIHCQATLKVIGYFFDLFDLDKGRPEGFLAYTAYVYFPFTSLVGPQFQYSRYKTFRESREIPASLKYCLQRFTLGMFYTAVFYSLNRYLSVEFLISEEFASYPLVGKLLYVVVWSKWLITKYCAIWLVAESAAGLTGIGAQPGSDPATGTATAAGAGFHGIDNMHVRKFEFSLTIQDELSSFNMQTHQWVKRNVYKRCKAFRSPALSRVISLLFLYLWHGLYIGFFNLFLIEALGISTEEVLCKYVSRERLQHYLPAPVLVVLQYLLKNLCVGYGLCGFALRTIPRCHHFYSSVYYCFHWGMGVLVLGEVLRPIVYALVFAAAMGIAHLRGQELYQDDHF